MSGTGAGRGQYEAGRRQACLQGRVTPVADMVRLHVTADLPMRVEPPAFAGRVEVRFGNAFPAVLLVDRAALPRLVRGLTEGQAALEQVISSTAGRHVLVEEVGDDFTGDA